jgi:hypothetical protein
MPNFSAISRLGGIDDGADPGGDAAADIADLVERGVLANFGERDLGQHGEIRKRRAAHVMEHLTAVAGESRGLVRHQSLALGRADRRAEVGTPGQAGFALPAFGRVERNDVVADFQRSHAGADLAHDPGALMAQDRGEFALGIQARKRIGVGVTDAGSHHLDERFAGLRAADFDGFDTELLVGFPGDGGARLHEGFPVAGRRADRAGRSRLYRPGAPLSRTSRRGFVAALAERGLGRAPQFPSVTPAEPTRSATASTTARLVESLAERARQLQVCSRAR